MNRREILKLGAALAVAPSVPVAAMPSCPPQVTWRPVFAGPAQRAFYEQVFYGRLVFMAGATGAMTITRQGFNEATGMWEDV